MDFSKKLKHKKQQLTSNKQQATTMKVSVSYRFFMEFFRFVKTGWDLKEIMQEISGQEKSTELVLIDLIINMGHFDKKVINKHQKPFTEVLGFMTAMIDCNCDMMKEKYIRVMEAAELSVQNGILSEQKYLSTCNIFKMLSNDSSNLKQYLEIAEPKSFAVKDQNTIELTLIMK